jgi:hypothetical protein
MTGLAGRLVAPPATRLLASSIITPTLLASSPAPAQDLETETEVKSRVENYSSEAGSERHVGTLQVRDAGRLRMWHIHCWCDLGTARVRNANGAGSATATRL